MLFVLLNIYIGMFIDNVRSLWFLRPFIHTFGTKQLISFILVCCYYIECISKLEREVYL